MVRQYVVRIVMPAEYFGADIIECLRYAGTIRIIQDDDSAQVIDLYPNKNIGNSKVWSEQNSARMRTFGWNAVSAPT